MHTLEELRSGKLKGIKKLTLRACGLTEFPQEIFELADTLEHLDISENQLSTLPADFSRLKHLKIIFSYHNSFTELPAVLGECEHLRIIGFRGNQISHVPEESLPVNLQWLVLTDNKIEHLPASIGKCKKLQKCTLAGNKLTALPDEMAQCRSLELLRISVNQFASLPNWLFMLPRLAWLSYSANPCSYDIENTDALPSISWGDLTIGEELGVGTSGHTYGAVLGGDTSTDVAVKIFKGSLTTDGYPENEQAIYSAVGEHDHLVSAIGEVPDHPEGKQVLVMNRIPSSYSVLGGTPSLDTCTRDVFSADRTFSITEVYTILIGVSGALEHMHSYGIMHGDLYAHNTLVNSEGNAIVSDFGAAMAYQMHGPISQNMERLDVRAFGCLMDDLLTRIEDTDSPEKQRLDTLREACLQELVLDRPSFAEIRDVIEHIIEHRLPGLPE